MEFLHRWNYPVQPIDSIRINWFYRPKDIARPSSDTRVLFATMHSDIIPLNTLRGKCTVKHKAEIYKAAVSKATPHKAELDEKEIRKIEIASFDEYRTNPDCFWWDTMYDRYIQKVFDAVPTWEIQNVPERVKKVLDERWKFILVEPGRKKELTKEVKKCKRCNNNALRYVPNHSSPFFKPPPLVVDFFFFF